MTKLLEIETALLRLDPANFQRLGEAYLYKRGYQHPHPIGLVLGRAKTQTGTPDTLLPEADGQYVLAEYTTIGTKLEAKLAGDVRKCLDESQSGIPVARIREIVLCYTGRLTPKALQRLTKRCEGRGVKVRFVTAGELAHAMYAEFPGLARDFLGVAVDTGQVMTMEEFIAASSRHTFSTPLDTTFRFREESLDQAVAALCGSDVLLVAGRPGVGKSRLALECCRRYLADHPEAQLRCIVARGRDLFEDLQVYFRAPGHYLLLVDDTNRLTRFEYVLSLMAEPRADRTVKIVATVRDYALDSSENVAHRYAKPVIMTVEPLSEEEIRTLIAEETGVTAFEYVERIVRIAQGNPRLALMAARLAVEKQSLNSLADTSTLYDAYFRSIGGDLDFALEPSLLLAAGIIGFFRQVDRANQEQMAEIERVFGISPEIFWGAVQTLHRIEAVDLYENQVVKVSDQVLATYLLFRAMFRERVLEVRVLLDHFFPRLRHRLVDALNPILTVFDSERLLAELGAEVQEARAAMLARRDEDAALHVLDLFWFALPADALRYVADTVNAMPEPAVPATDFIESRDAVPFPSPLSILSRFSDAEPSLRRSALQLVARYLERDPASAPLLVRILRESYGLSPESLTYGFSRERAVLDTLWEMTQDGQRVEVVRLLLTFAESVLRTHVRDIRGTRKGIRIIPFDVPDTPEVASLRRRAWEIVGYALRSPLHHQTALGLISTHAGGGYEIGNPAIVAQDAQIVLPLLRETVSLQEYAEVGVARDYCTHMRRIGLPIPEDMLAHFTTPETQVAELVGNDWLEEVELGHEEYQKKKASRITEFVDGADEATLNALLASCLAIRRTLIDGHDQWQLENGVHHVMATVAARKPEVFVTTLFEQLGAGNPLRIEPWSLAGWLIRILGIEEVMTRLKAAQFPRQRHWLSTCYLEAPDDVVTPALARRLLEHYQEAPSEQLPPDLGYLLRYDAVAPGTLWAVILLLAERAERGDRVSGRLLGNGLWARGEIGKDLVQLFGENVALLKRMYLEASRSEPHTDLHAEVFDLIVSLDPGFIEEWLDSFLSGRSEIRQRDDNREYSRLWRRPDYLAITRRFIDGVHLRTRALLSFEPYLLVLFRHPQGTADLTELERREDEVLDLLIQQRHRDHNFIQFLFEVVGHLPSTRRVGRLRSLLQVNPSIELFRSLTLEPHMSMAHGSWVPTIQGKIEYYQSLLGLCDSVDLLPHRQLLEEKIGSLRDWMEREKRSDFMED